MASEWEMAMGVDLGMGMSAYHHHHNASGITTAPMSGSYSTPHHHHYYGMPPMGDATMRVDDLLDLSNAGAHEFFPTAAGPAGATDNGHHHSGAMGEPSPTANSSDHQTSLLSFADEFYIPTEEAAELEWLSKFVDDSYSDIPNYSSAAHAAMAAAAAGNGGGNSAGQDSCVTAAPGRGARSKRSRATAAAAAAWHSLVPRPPSQSSPSSSSCSSSDFPSSNKPARPNGSNANRGKKSPGPGGPTAGEVGLEGGVRRCTHCASEKTPQWRTGPLGPKTLCNACGVRFKSGRLVPEYRPAASPTFVLTQHSNSHRKVMELRRQKELLMIRGSHRDAAAAAAASAAAGAAGPRPELMFRDYGVC
ncbi:hypothetical protein QOZ80_2BG0170070 [Eleusine coracana subsp. coracana]|nr:hypothetical protein QOZ80_2BG0170070 [Eleusine coracana subsp. coracana]